MSATIYSATASRAVKTRSADECDQEPFSFPSGSSESPTPPSARSARVFRFYFATLHFHFGVYFLLDLGGGTAITNTNLGKNNPKA